MPRYKHIDMSPRLLPVDLSAQIVPGNFEYALARLIDHELDLSALENQGRRKDKAKRFSARDFIPSEDFSHCICPVGRRLYRNGHHHDLNGLEAVKFTAAQRDCLACPMRAQCLRHPECTKVRQVTIFTGCTPGKPETSMQRRVGSDAGLTRIAQHFALVEPVFGNLCYKKSLDRCTLRGKTKVDAQRKLYCVVHNIEKLARNGYAIERKRQSNQLAHPTSRCLSHCQQGTGPNTYVT